jgi:hypothetical protein
VLNVSPFWRCIPSFVAARVPVMDPSSFISISERSDPKKNYGEVKYQVGGQAGGDQTRGPLHEPGQEGRQPVQREEKAELRFSFCSPVQEECVPDPLT